MKIPKLKYYYLALAPDGYAEFEQSRKLPITGVNIDIVTGTVSGRDHWLLCSTADRADNIVRELFRYRGRTYVLRIPRDCVDRSALMPDPAVPECWRYNRTISVPHCGVYAMDLADQ